MNNGHSGNLINHSKVNEDASTNISTSDRARQGRGKKRIIKGDTRKVRNTRKICRNKGEEYITKSGKTVSKRKSTSLGWCRMKCQEKVEQYREELFKGYWAVGDGSKRASYIASLIELRNIKQHRPRHCHASNRHYRQVTAVYSVHVNGQTIKVCKKCFRQIFDESNKFIETVIRKKRASVSGIIQDDMRGTHSPTNKTSQERLRYAYEHLLSLPSYESHYTRRDSSKKYLPSHYTISLCYEEYKKTCSNVDAVSEKIYRQLFHDMKLSIKTPNKDTCQTCDRLNMEINMSKTQDNRLKIQQQLTVHQTLADKAYDAKAKDRSASKNDPSKKTITFDLQCLPTPHLQSSLCFYKRQLWVFNLTVHDCDDGQGYFFMWNENVAARGGNEIASCLYKYLLSLPPTVTDVTMYSDTCGGQNKNSHFATMCMVSLQDSPTLKSINHKFLIPGHSHMESDCDHSLIEKMKKKFSAPIEHPHDWIQLVRVASKKKPFVVHEMKIEDSFSFSGLLRKGPLQVRKFDQERQKVNWRDIKWFHYEQQDVGKFYFKTTLEESESFRTLDFRRRTQSSIHLKPVLAYNGPLAISCEKKRSLTTSPIYIRSVL